MASTMHGIPVAFLQRLAGPRSSRPAGSWLRVRAAGNASQQLYARVACCTTTRCASISTSTAASQQPRMQQSQPLSSDTGKHSHAVRTALSKRRKDLAQQIHQYGIDTSPPSTNQSTPARPNDDGRRSRVQRRVRHHVQSQLQQSSGKEFDREHAWQLWEQYVTEPDGQPPFIVRQKLFGELTLMFQPYIKSISSKHNQFVRDVLCDGLQKGLYLDRRLLNTCLHMLNANGYSAYAIDVFNAWTDNVGNDVSNWRQPNQYTFGVMTQVGWLAHDTTKTTTLTIHQLLAAKVKYNVDLDTRAYNALLSIANRDRQFTTAIDIYEKHMLPQVERQGTMTNNEIDADDDEAPNTTNKPRDNQLCIPDQQTLSLVTASYIYGQQIDKGIEIYNTIREAHLAGETTFNMNIKLIQPIVVAAIEQNMLPVAHSIVQQMHKDGIEHDAMFAEKITRCYLQREHHGEAVNAFKTLVRPKSRPSVGFYAYIIMHLRAFKRHDLEQQLYQLLEDDGYKRHNLEQRVIILQGQLLSKQAHQMTDLTADELVAALRAANKAAQAQ